MNIALIVPVLNRFDLFAGLMKTVDCNVRPFIIDNWNMNRGVSGAWNLGIRKAMKEKYRYALIANDDAYFHKGAIENLYKTIRREKAVIVSPNQNNSHEQKGLIEGADFFCFMVDMPKLIAECGYFDEHFYPAYFEDNDMNYRIELAGLKKYINTDIIVGHHGSQTQFKDPRNPVTSNEQFEKNSWYFISKWGGKPGNEIYTTPFDDPNMTIKEW